MLAPQTKPTWLVVDDYVGAFERALEPDGTTDFSGWSRFLPPSGSPLRLAVLRELVRVDLEHRWQRGTPREFGDYGRAFPELFADPDSLQEIAYEEFRLKRDAGQWQSPEEYQRRYGVATNLWTTLVPRATSERPVAPGSQAGAGPGGSAPQASLPQIGQSLAGFKLLAQLGQGAAATVYLAQQGELADRFVALKVSARQPGEPQRLAQLQHTNIVPIHSIHYANGWQAVCMPFCGCVTLADVLAGLAPQRRTMPSGKALVETLRHQFDSTVARLSVELSSHSPATDRPAASAAPSVLGSVAKQLSLSAALARFDRMSLVDAILWLAARLADGLAHAHDRGILHRDLKPANVLLADDGQPLWLDFHLAVDTKLAGPQVCAGGTLPYMSPEQLRAVAGEAAEVDARSDIYSLGVVIYEALCGQLPFPAHAGELSQIVRRQLADRQPGPPRMGAAAGASPAVESIVRKCLAADPAARYQSAHELATDLTRQLSHQPLRYAPDPSPLERLAKWRRRHPRMSSSAAVATAAALLLAAVAGVAWRLHDQLTTARTRDAAAALVPAAGRIQFHLSRPSARPSEIEQALDAAKAATAPWETGSENPPRWNAARLTPADQTRLREAIAELHGWAGQTLLDRAASSPDEAERRKAMAAAEEQMRRAENWLAPLGTSRAAADDAVGPRDRYWRAAELYGQRKYREALELLEHAAAVAPEQFRLWQLQGFCHFQLGQWTEAVGCYSTCLALWPEAEWSYFNRGVTYLRQEKYDAARRDFDHCLKLRPDQSEALVNRALAAIGLADYAAAVEDITTAIELGQPRTRLWFIRARAKELAGDLAGAAADRSAGLGRPPVEDDDFVARGIALVANDPLRALGEFEQALNVNPQCPDALESQAAVLAERLGRAAEAVAALDRLLQIEPHNTVARAGRAVLRARQHDREGALADARECLLRDDRPSTLYQLAGVYALTSQQVEDDRRQALRLLATALERGYGRELVAIDPDLAPLRESPEFGELVAGGGPPPVDAALTKDRGPADSRANHSQ